MCFRSGFEPRFDARGLGSGFGSELSAELGWQNDLDICLGIRLDFNAGVGQTAADIGSHIRQNLPIRNDSRISQGIGVAILRDVVRRCRTVGIQPWAAILRNEAGVIVGRRNIR